MRIKLKNIMVLCIMYIICSISIVNAEAFSSLSTTEMLELSPGEIIEHEMDLNNLDDYFIKTDITYGDPIYERINGKSYRENPNVALEDLCYLKMLHYNFDHEKQVGEMIVNRQIADDVLSLFKELFEIEYEICSMYLIDNYWTGDGTSSDYASIDVNNTSCFNYREATGSANLSDHAYGRAIDINPQQNPYVRVNADGSKSWSHSNANDYIDRSLGLAHVIVQGDECYKIFEKYGFQWGGNWSNPIDYQHFYTKGEEEK